MLDDAISEGLAIAALGEALDVGWQLHLVRQLKLRAVCLSHVVYREITCTNLRC